jgi:signal transduction histidine kinase
MSFEATAAQERDRRRIAVDLHDRIGQSLALAQIVLTSISDASSADARAAITEAIELIKQSVLDTRSLTFELSPPILYDLGLAAAISWHAEQVEVSRGQRVEVHETGEAIVLDDTTAAVVFRTVRELLMNVFKHAQTLTARVWLRRTGDWLHVTVEDKGVGFDPGPEAILASGSFGLFSVREQISRLGGTVEIVSAKGQGTRVHVQVPLEQPLPEDG